jgi:hypothetical protein
MDPMSPNFFLVALGKGIRSCTTQHPINQFVSTNSLLTSLSCFISHLLTISIPKIVQDALFDFGWGQAMELEMDALHKNGMLELVSLLHEKKIVGCK